MRFVSQAESNIWVYSLRYGHGSIDGGDLASGPVVLTRLAQRKTGRHPVFLAAELFYAAEKCRFAFFDAINTQFGRAFSSGKKTVALGGDHSLSAPIIMAAAAVFPSLQVLQIDAHSDFRGDAIDAEMPNHANFVDHLLVKAQISNWYVWGMRSSNAKLHPSETALELDGRKWSIDPNLPTYLTIDLDGFDPSLALAVRHPEPFGLHYQHIEQLLGKKLNIIGIDVMEYDPSLDSKNLVTGHFALGLLNRLIDHFWD